MIWKCVMYINGPTDGWSEELFHQDSQNSAQAVSGALEYLLAKRALFLGNPYQIVAYRISAYANNDGSRPTTRRKFFKRKLFPSPGPNLAMQAEPGNVGVDVTMLDASTFFSTRLTIGGPPDDAVTAGGQVNLAGAGFGTLLGNYIAALVSTTSLVTTNWGWGSVGTPFQSDIVQGWPKANPDGTVNIKFKDPLPIWVVPNHTYPARLARINYGKSDLNGQLLVTPHGDGTVDSKEGIAFFANTIGGYIKIYPELRQYLTYASGDPVLFSVKHHRGRPFGTSRGRRPARPRG